MATSPHLTMKKDGPGDHFFPFALIILLTLVFFHPVLFQGKTFFAFDALQTYLPWSAVNPIPRANNPLITDPVNLNYPFYQYVAGAIREKSFPLWVTTNFCGLPVSAGGLTSITYPLRFLALLFLPVTAAHDLMIGLHLLGAGIFLYLYLRAIHLAALPSCLGAVSWMFNGYAMVWFEFEIVVILAVSLPAALYFFERWLFHRSFSSCLGFACAIGVSIGSGFPHIIIFQTLLILGYILYRCVGKVRHDRAHFRFHGGDLKHVGLTLVMVGLMSATFFISHFSTLEDNQRSGYTFSELYQKTGKLHARYLTTLVFPDLFGSPARSLAFTPRIEGPQPYNNYNELCIYAGILPLFLAVVCIPHLLRRKHLVFFTLSALLPLTMAMGSVLFYPLYRFIPGLDLSTPSRILYLFGFAMSVLAAVGADILLTEAGKRRLPVFLCGSCLFGAIIVFSLVLPMDMRIDWLIRGSFGPEFSDTVRHYFGTTPEIFLRPLALSAISFLLLTAILYVGKPRWKQGLLGLGLVVLAADLIPFGLRYNTVAPTSSAYPPTEAIGFLRQHAADARCVAYGNFLHNFLAPFDIDDIGGYTPFYPQRYGELLHLSQYGPEVPAPVSLSRWTHFTRFGSPLLDLINTRFLLLPGHLASPHDHLRLVFDGEVKIYENTDAFPRAFFVPAFQHAVDRRQAYRLLGKFTRQDFSQKVILETPPPDPFAHLTQTARIPSAAKVRIISRGPNTLTIAASADTDGFVVLSEGFQEAWRATVDGRPAPVLRANYAMRAVPIPKGEHRIVLSFRPFWIVAALLATAAGWAVLVMAAAGVGWKALRKRRLPARSARAELRET